MKTRLMLRQGDVMFERIGQLPSGVCKKRSDGAVAYGEVTGHSHRISDLDAAEVLEIDGGIFVTVSDKGIAISGVPGATVVHEEHGPATLPPGNYRVTIQREYAPEGIRNVID